MSSLALRIAGALPDGFAMQERTTMTNRGVEDTAFVLCTRAPESGRFGRRIANVTSLDGQLMRPFDDAPYGAVDTLLKAGWALDG